MAKSSIDVLKGGVVATYNREDRSENKLFKYSGVSSSKLFPHAKREGIASILDSGIKRGDARKREYALGQGAVSMKFYHEDGSEIVGEDATLNIGGMNFTPSSDGTFRMVDEKWLNEVSEIEFARRKYIASIAYRMVTDEVFSKTIGVLDKTKFEELCTNAATGKALGMPVGIAEVSCLPSMIDSYVPESQIWALALAKQRFLLGYFMPILQKDTKTGQIGAKDAIDVPEGEEGGLFGGTPEE